MNQAVAVDVRSICRRPSEKVVNDVRKPWWSMFGSGGERCSKEVVRKCHLQGSQMPSARVANAIREGCKWHLQPTISEQRQPPFSNNGNHYISTMATTLSEQRFWIWGGGDLPQRANGRGESHSPHKNDSNNAFGFVMDEICHNGK
jgi:hypothetical protein